MGQSTPDELKLDDVRPLLIKAMGRGQHQVCDNDKFGFRRKKNNGEFNAPRLIKRVHGFQTGDVARIKVPRGKYTGDYLTRIISVRKTGSFSIKPAGSSKPFPTNHKMARQSIAPTAKTKL